MKTNFSRFGKSAVSVVLSAVMLLSTFLVSAETINVDSVSEAVASDSAAVDSSSAKAAGSKKSDVKALPQASADTSVSNLPTLASGKYRIFLAIDNGVWSTKTPSVYTYYGSSKNADWPGNAMTKLTGYDTSKYNSLYYYDIPIYNSGNGQTIIFNNGDSSSSAGSQTKNIDMDSDHNNWVYRIYSDSWDQNETNTETYKKLANTNWYGAYSNSGTAAVNKLTIYAKDGTVRYNTKHDYYYDKFSRMADTKIYDANGSSIGSDKLSKDNVTPIAETASVEVGTQVKISTTVYKENKGGTTGADFDSLYKVAGFVVNGDTYKVETEETTSDGTVYSFNYTVPLDQTTAVEITPVYFYKTGEYITFYVEDFKDEVKINWDQTIAAYVWYGSGSDTAAYNSSEKPAFGGYPGQPLFFDGSRYYTQVPKYLDDNKTISVQGVTLNNYIWDDIHSEILGKDQYINNWQTYDYDDFSALQYSSDKNYKGADSIVFRFEYRSAMDNYNNTTNGGFADGTDNTSEIKRSVYNGAHKPPVDGTNSYYAATTGIYKYNNTYDNWYYTKYCSNNGSIFKTIQNNIYNNYSSYLNGWDVLTDINSKPVDVFDNLLDSYTTIASVENKNHSGVVHVVSDGYKDDNNKYIGRYATMWYVYDTDGNFAGALPPSAFLYTPTEGASLSEDLVPANFLAYNDKANAQTDDEKSVYWKTYYNLYTNSKVKGFPTVITYESNKLGSNNFAYRCDGRWFYSKSGVTTISAEVKIQYGEKTSGVFTGDSSSSGGNGFDKFIPNSNQGTDTGVKAYFTNDDDNNYYGKTSTGNITSSSQDDKFNFTVDKESFYIGNDLYIFNGWYVQNKQNSDEYDALNSGNNVLDKDSSYPMTNGAVLVARYVKVPSSSLVVSHTLLADDTTENKPETHNGTGTPRVSVSVIGPSGTVYPIATNSTAPVDITAETVQYYKALNDAVTGDSKYKLQITLTTDTDENTSVVGVYRKDGTTYYRSDINGFDEDTNKSSAASADTSLGTVTPTGDSSSVVYTYSFDDLFTKGTSTLKTTTLAYESDLFAKTISANVIIQYEGDTADSYVTDPFADPSDVTSTEGSKSGINANFTNTKSGVATYNGKTATGEISPNADDSFNFTVDDDSFYIGDQLYVFDGWYVAGDDKTNYTDVKKLTTTNLASTYGMTDTNTFIARYKKVSSDDKLTISHELLKSADDTTYPPTAGSGTGTPKITVDIVDGSGNVIKNLCTNSETALEVDHAVLEYYESKGYELKVQVITEPDDEYTTIVDGVYRYGAEDAENLTNSYYKSGVYGDEDEYVTADTYGTVAGTAATESETSTLTYTYKISDLYTTDTTTWVPYLKYYSSLSITQTIEAKVVIKYYDPTSGKYETDTFTYDDYTGDDTIGEFSGVHACFYGDDFDRATSVIVAIDPRENFEFEVDKKFFIKTNSDGTITLYKFEGWFLGDNADDSTRINSDDTETNISSTGSRARTESATFVAKYTPVTSNESIEISHVLLSSIDDDSKPTVHNGTATPKVTVEFVKDSAETVTFATEQDTTTTPVQIEKDVLKSYEEQGYSLKVTVIADESSDKLVGAYRYGYGYNNETSTVTETNAYYKSGNHNLETTEDSSKTTDTLATIGDPDTTTANRTTIVYTYDISKLFGTGDDSNTLKVPSLKHITDFGTDKVNIIFKYYDRAMNAADSKPTDINTTPSTTTFEEQIGTTENTNVGKIASAITDAAAEVNREKLIENVIDDYKFWTTQADAEKSLKGWTDMRRSEKKEDNTPYTYADLDRGDKYKYHTDRYSRVKGQTGYSLADDDKSGDEQWVTYYSDDACKNAITFTGDDISNSDLYRVKNVVVWGFNYPKTYNVSFKTSLDTSETVGGITIAKAAAKDEEGKEINQRLPYYYNQRVGTTIDNNVIDNDTPHLKAYGFASTTGTEITAPDYDVYDFDGWYENVNGNYVKVSSDKSYGNRVTKTTTLYAGYRAEGIKTKGITLTQNDVEHYVTTEGTPRVRYVTMLNAYGFDDSDPNFKKLSLVYVKFANRADLSGVTVNSILANGDLKNAIISKLKEESGKSVDQLTVTISNVTTDESVTGTKEISYTYNIVATPTDGSGDSETSVSTGSIRFTNKNRAQFVLDLKETAVSGDEATSPNLLVFAVVKYADSTIYSNDNPNPYKNEINSDNDYVYLASDNYVIYQNGEAVK